MIFIVVRWKPKAAHVDSFMDDVAEFTAATRNEPGNLFFDWSRSIDDPTEYILVEGFRDGDAGKEHVGSEHFKKFVADAPALLSATPRIISHEIDATGWGEMGEIKVD